MENECEALPGVAYPGVRDNRSTINTKTGYDDDDDLLCFCGTDLVEKICYFEDMLSTDGGADAAVITNYNSYEGYD